MKIFTLLLLSIFIKNFVVAQKLENPADKELIERKIQDYKKMKRVGTYMMIGGGVIAGVGAILISNYDYKPTQVGTSPDEGTGPAIVFATGVITSLSG